MKYVKTSPVPHTVDAPIESMTVDIDGSPVGTFVEGDAEFVIENETVHLKYALDPAVIGVGDHSASVTISNGWEEMEINYPFVRPLLPVFTVFISGS